MTWVILGHKMERKQSKIKQEHCSNNTSFSLLSLQIFGDKSQDIISKPTSFTWGSTVMRPYDSKTRTPTPSESFLITKKRSSLFCRFELVEKRQVGQWQYTQHLWHYWGHKSRKKKGTAGTKKAKRMSYFFMRKWVGSHKLFSFYFWYPILFYFCSE